MDKNIKNIILEIIEKELNIQLNELDFDGDFREQTNIDSMQFISITAHIEKKINIELSPDIIGVNTLNEFFSFIEKEIKNK